MQQVIWDKNKLQKNKKGEKPFNTLEGFLKDVKLSEKEIDDALEEAKFKFDYDHIIHQKHNLRNKSLKK